MKQFAFYVTIGKPDRAGNNTDRVTVIRIQNGKPVSVGSAARGFRTPAQAARDIAIANGHLGQVHRTAPPARLFNDGIANFTEV